LPEIDGTGDWAGGAQAQLAGLQPAQDNCRSGCVQDRAPECQQPGDPRARQGDLAAGGEARVAFHVTIDDQASTREGFAGAVPQFGQVMIGGRWFPRLGLWTAAVSGQLHAQ